MTIIAAVPTRPRAVPVDAPHAPDRRQAARRLALAALAAACAEHSVFAAAASPPAAGRIAATFVAFCDTLVPADDLTPGASALGIPAAILAELAGNTLAERLLAAGCDWLDAAASGSFAVAAESVRVAACERMQLMPWQSPAGRFFALMRNTVMALYYAEPASWRGLALDRPPQPLGFFDAVR